MSVRAKFKVIEIRSTELQQSTYSNQLVEMKSIILAPVYGNSDPEHENSKFWRYTPSGKIELGTINPEASSQFELGKEYYIDFTKA